MTVAKDLGLGRDSHDVTRYFFLLYDSWVPLLAPMPLLSLLVLLVLVDLTNQTNSSLTLNYKLKSISSMVPP